LKQAPVGMPIDVDLANLVDKLVVGPDQPNWVPSLMTRLLERYGISKSDTLQRLRTKVRIALPMQSLASLVHSLWVVANP
jgi:hypothetical protein